MNRPILPALVLALAPLSAAHAAQVTWTDWTTSNPGLVTGTLAVPSGNIGVSASGAFIRTQISGGTNYWIPSAPYIGAAIENAPPGTDIIELNVGGTETITFSQAVVDPLIALVSWNGNTVKFSTPIDIVSHGRGFWGDGTPVPNATGDGFFGSGEVHGVVRLPGTYTSISFTHTSENWHGFTVGITSAVPEPDTRVLLALALPLLALSLRRRTRR